MGLGYTEIGPDQIRRFTVFGRWEMRWNEVEWIEIDLLESVRDIVLTNVKVNGTVRNERITK